MLGRLKQRLHQEREPQESVSSGAPSSYVDPNAALPPEEAPAVPHLALSPLAAMAQKAPARLGGQLMAVCIDSLVLWPLAGLVMLLFGLLEPAVMGYADQIQLYAGQVDKERTVVNALTGLLHYAALSLVVGAFAGVVLQAALLSSKRAATVGAIVTGIRWVNPMGMIPSVKQALGVALSRFGMALVSMGGIWWAVEGLRDRSQLAMAGNDLHRPMLEQAVVDATATTAWFLLLWFGGKLVGLIGLMTLRAGLAEKVMGLRPVRRSSIRPL